MAREFKDSGIEWIGQIPKEWECTCFKRFHNDANVGESIDKNFCSDNENDTLFYTAGLKPIHTTYKDFPTWKYTSNNDLLLARNGTPYVYLPLPESIYSDHIIRVGIKEKYIREYARYCIQQAISFVVVDAVSIATWSISLWDKQFLPIPSLHEQQKIADYLDKVCGEVDEMVALQETMIEELKAYKQSVITEAVTKGLNPNAPMRDSGIDWIGEMPEHWEVQPFKWILRKPLQYGANESGLLYDESLPRYVRITDIFNNCLREDLQKQSLTEEQADGYILEDNDILFARSGGTVGKAFIYKKGYGRCAFAGYLIRAQINSNCCPDYVYYYTQSQSYDEWKRQIFIQATIQNIGADRYSLMELPVPPLSEQRTIASYLDTKCSEIDSLIALKQAKIEELKEYKKSVIYEYVTGKKEVC